MCAPLPNEKDAKTLQARSGFAIHFPVFRPGVCAASEVQMSVSGRSKSGFKAAIPVADWRNF
jgi:hypothetical protein